MAATTETPSFPRKRASPFDEEALPAGKRQRVGSIVPLSPVTGYTSVKNASPNDFLPSLDEQARSELRRSIALALDLVGFDSASEEALESFTLMTESCRFAPPLLPPENASDRCSQQMSSPLPKTYLDQRTPPEGPCQTPLTTTSPSPAST